MDKVELYVITIYISYICIYIYIYIYISLKKYVLSQKKGLRKRGSFNPFPSKLFFLKQQSQNHIFTHYRSSRRELFCKKGVLRNLAKFTGRHLWQSLFFNKVPGLGPATLLKKSLRTATLLKKRPQRRCFPVSFAKFGRTPFLVEHLRWLLLTLENIFENSFLFYGQCYPATLGNQFKLLPNCLKEQILRVLHVVYLKIFL